MRITDPVVRTFDTGVQDWTEQFGGRAIFITAAVSAAEGGPLSAYSAHFAQGEQADLPAPYAEVWVVLRGWLAIDDGVAVKMVREGEFLHVPANTPGRARAVEDTTLVCVSVPAH